MLLKDQIVEQGATGIQSIPRRCISHIQALENDRYLLIPLLQEGSLCQVSLFSLSIFSLGRSSLRHTKKGSHPQSNILSEAFFRALNQPIGTHARVPGAEVDPISF